LEGRLSAATRKESRAQTFSTPLARSLPRRSSGNRSRAAAPGARSDLSLPRVRRIPLPSDRSVHGLARAGRFRADLLGAVSLFLRCLRDHSRRSSRRGLEGVPPLRGFLSRAASGASPPLLPGVPQAARGAPPVPPP